MAHPLVHFNHVYSDYEFLGNIQDGAHTCNVWHIGAVKADNTKFEIYIQVDTNRETHEGCVEVTEEYLAERSAEPFASAFQKFVARV